MQVNSYALKIGPRRGDGEITRVTHSLIPLTMSEKWPSPLQDYQGPRDALPTEFNSDGRSLKNTPGPRSSVWDQAPKPFVPNNANFDFHSEYRRDSISGSRLSIRIVYYNRSDGNETKFARELHERLRREFPEVSPTAPPSNRVLS